jgi:hypothetical protein
MTVPGFGRVLTAQAMASHGSFHLQSELFLSAKASES